MKIKYLGTSAAEGIPAMFCECEICKKSRALGGKNIRTRSQALIDNSLLLDFPSDTFSHFLKYDIPMSKIEACLITHSHEDHLCVNEIIYRKHGFARIYSDKRLTFYSDCSSFDIIKRKLDFHQIPTDTVNNALISPFVPFDASGYKVTALRASHSAATAPVVYLIEKDGKTLLYSHDSSEYPEESIEYLKNFGKHIDFVSSDCTEGTKEISYVGHLNLQRNIKMREHFDRMGITDKNTVWCLNHFSHNGGHDGGVVIYDDFSKIAEGYGFITSYDGLEIEF